MQWSSACSFCLSFGCGFTSSNRELLRAQVTTSAFFRMAWKSQKSELRSKKPNNGRTVKATIQASARKLLLSFKKKYSSSEFLKGEQSIKPSCLYKEYASSAWQLYSTKQVQDKFIGEFLSEICFTDITLFEEQKMALRRISF